MHTNPEGAECTLTRKGDQLGKVVTPGIINMRKLKYDIDVKCSMDGFYDSTAHINSGIQGSVFGNTILGGGVGWAFDSAKGADNKYADVVTVTMVPLSLAAPDAVKIDVNGKVSKLGDVKSTEAKKTRDHP